VPGPSPHNPSPYGQPPYGQEPPSGPSPYGQWPPSDQAPYGQLPQYGQYQPGPYGTPTPFAPATDPKPAADPKDVRPRRLWIWLSWGIALLCVLVGAGLFGAGVFNSVTSAAPVKTFTSGGSATVTLDPAERPAIYLDSDTRVHYTCRISGGPAQARLVNTRSAGPVTDGTTQWQLILLVNAPRKGDYQVACETVEATGARFGVGRDLNAFAGTLAGGALALFLVPGLGILIAIVVTVVVLVRRGGHRKRLATAG
jgi:hypothetical protein